MVITNDRTHNLKRLKKETFDLLVIGGGVTGAGIALDAASRGLKTVLVEKEDFASGTSSKSTKLIHGGLRYLKQLDLALVRETGTERAIVHRLAPHLVLPEKMLMPITKGGTYGYLSTSIGLKIYDILADVKGEDKRKMLTKAEALKLEPLLNPTNLIGGGFYAEYRTDDARLTIELIKTAIRHGAVITNYCNAVEFTYDKNIVSGAICQDVLSNITCTIKAKKIVVAGGPWVDQLRKKDNSLHGKRLHLTKGVHIVVSHTSFPIQNTIYFDIPDGRMVFAIPRGKVTYIGTTDTNYNADLDKVFVTQKDTKYLLDAVNATFPTIHLNTADIVSSWAGLRPLIHEDGKSPSELSRKDEIFISNSELIAIAGGKLTGYRKMAQRVVDKVSISLGNISNKCITQQIPLTPHPLENSKEVNQYILQLQKTALNLGLEKYYGWYLATTYGRQSEIILEKMKTFKDAPEVALIRAEAWFGVQEEMVQRATDFFVRRTGRLFFNIDSIRPTKDKILSDLSNYLGWNTARIHQEQDLLNQSLHNAIHYNTVESEAKVTK